ncbi:MAG: hypothetical protein MUE60_06630 [Candidatus Eisenbacteria bacterium]|nr:hypothetical protein [Candidatus Eisenbacteria bacterium]
MFHVLVLMPLVFLAALLAFERRRRLTRTYLEIAKSPSSGPDTQREALRMLEAHTRGSSLRRGIFGTVFGLVLVIIPLMLRVFMRAIPEDVVGHAPGLVPAFAQPWAQMGLLLIAGLVVLGFGVANLAVWLLADRHKEAKTA